MIDFTGYKDSSSWAKHKLWIQITKYVSTKEMKRWYLPGGMTDRQTTRLWTPSISVNGEGGKGSVLLGYRDKRGDLSPKLWETPQGYAPVDSPFIWIKKAEDSPLSLFGIKIIEQAYWSRNFPNKITRSKNHRSIERLGFEGTLNTTESQPSAMDRVVTH